jgi:hypothetical protein
MGSISWRRPSVLNGSGRRACLLSPKPRARLFVALVGSSSFTSYHPVWQEQLRPAQSVPQSHNRSGSSCAEVRCSLQHSAGATAAGHILAARRSRVALAREPDRSMVDKLMDWIEKIL